MPRCWTCWTCCYRTLFPTDFSVFFAVFQHSSLTPSWCFTRCHFDESKVKNGTAPAPPKQYRPKTAPKRYLAMEAYWQNNPWSKTSYQKSGVCCFNPKFVNYPHPNSGKWRFIGIPYSKCSTILVVTGIVGGWWIQCATMNEWYWNDTEWSWIVFLMEEILHQQYPMFHMVSQDFIYHRVVIAGFLPSVSTDVSAVSTGPDPRKRPSIPPAWNAGPGVKVPKDHRPQGVATLVFWRKNVSFGVFSYSLGLKIKISTWSTWGFWKDV